MLTTLYWLFGLFSVLGFSLHFSLHKIPWKKVTWRGTDWVVKCFPDLLGLGVLILTSFAKFVEEKDWVAWAFAYLLAGSAVVIWKLLQYRIESLLKNVEREATAEAQRLATQKIELEREATAEALRLATQKIDRAKAEIHFLTELRVALVKSLSSKVRHVSEVVRSLDPEKTVRIDSARKALAPKPETRQILDSLGIMLETRVSKKTGRQPNIRLGVYATGADGVMAPLHAVSMNQRHSEPFSSYREHREGFRVATTERPSQIVRCVQEKTTIMIVANCEQAERDGLFHFFSDAQRQYLKSVCVHYLEEVCDPAGRMVEGVLSIDADQPNAFEENEREELLLCLKEFGLRIKFEMLLIALLRERT